MKKIIAGIIFVLSIMLCAPAGYFFGPIEAHAEGGTTTVSGNSFSKQNLTTAQVEKKIWKYLKKKLKNEYGVAGLMGNLFAESGLKPDNVENRHNIIAGITDEAYTEAVDDGTYTKEQFIKDAAGYGLAQWTYWTRKQGLWNYAQARNKSISDLDVQLEYLVAELNLPGYKPVMDGLKNAATVQDASDIVLVGFEKPANQGDIVKNKRAWYGQIYFDRYSSKPKDVEGLRYSSSATAIKVKWEEIEKKCTGYEIQYSTSKKFSAKKTKTIRIDDSEVTSKKIKKLKEEKTYYIRVRAVNTSGTTDYYSNWSETKKIKTK